MKSIIEFLNNACLGIFGMFRTIQKCVFIFVPHFPYARLSVMVRDEMSLPSHLGYFDPTIEFGSLVHYRNVYI
jgi:hypothetical protein